MATAPLWDRLRHPLVRTLAWLIGSPGLLAAGAPAHQGKVVGDDWCAAALADSTLWLLAEDAAPHSLEAFVALHRSARLGRLAENLLAYWFMHFARFALIARNLAVRDGGTTLGEFDFVFRDHAERRVVHWESAVKFYLFRPEIGGLAGFVGPGERDTLAAKAEKVFSQQLKLAATRPGRAVLHAIGVEPEAALAFVKGRLFHPETDGLEPAEVNPDHARGWWRRCDRVGNLPGAHAGRYRRIDRLDWMTPGEAAAQVDAWNSAQCEAALAAHFAAGGAAVMLAQLREDAGRLVEVGRGFVPPPGWGATRKH